LKDANRNSDGRDTVPSFDHTSTSLILRAKHGDQDAWRRLLKLYYPLVIHWCRNAAVPDADRPDVAQETLLTVDRKIDEFRHSHQTGSFRSWLKKITLYKAMEYRSRCKQELSARGGSDNHDLLVQIPNGQNAGSSITTENDERSIIRRAALELTRSEFEQTTWEAAWRVVVEDRSPEEVASELRISRNAVYIAKSRVLTRIREVLADLE
jgi:RNA polymerase sigma-70 factor (ECF subfamily)